MATIIADCATDTLAKVYVDRYLGHQHNLKMTPNNRLSFEQSFLSPPVNTYWLKRQVGVADIDQM